MEWNKMYTWWIQDDVEWQLLVFKTYEKESELYEGGHMTECFTTPTKAVADTYRRCVAQIIFRRKL